MERNCKTLVAMGAILLLLVLGQTLLPVATYAQEANDLLTQEQALDKINGPIFLDAYWTDRGSSSPASSSRSTNDSSTRKEVGPGDGLSTLAVVLANRGTADITAITGTLTLPEGFSGYGSGGTDITTSQASFYQLVKAGETFTLYFDILVSDKARVSPYNANLLIEYNNIREVGSFRNVSIDVPFRLTGKPILEVSAVLPSNTDNSNNETTSAISAGKVENYSFQIANVGTAPITSVVTTIQSSTDSMTILGKSKWTMDKIDVRSQVELSTQLFAAESLIGNPTSLDVTVQYSSNGRESTQTFKLGTYVGGDISLRVYDLTINIVGSTPTLVGNILNEGNTAALFTTVELVQQSTSTTTPSTPSSTFGQNQNQFQPRNNFTAGTGDLGGNNQFRASNGNFTRQFFSQSPPSPQYLGDLTPNSPLPFSIPMSGSGNGGGTFQGGGLPVTLKIKYKDNLRNSHEFMYSGTAHLAQHATIGAFGAQGRNNQNQGFFDLPLLVWIGIAIAAAAGIAAAIVITRRKRAHREARANSNGVPAYGQERQNIEHILKNPHDVDPEKG